MKPLWTVEKKALLQQFETREQGLSTSEAIARLEQYGENLLQEGSRKSVIQVFAEQFTDLLVVILIAAAVISALTGGVESAIVIGAVLLLNAVLGTVQHMKAQKSLDSLKSMAAPMACVIRNSEKTEIAAAQLVPGDILLLEAGDIAAADGRILEHFSLQVNESALTGESEAVNKTDACLQEETLPLGDRTNMVYSGSQISYGRGVVLVTATGMNTEIGQIAHLMETAQETQTPLQRSLHDFSKNLSVAVLLLCVVLLGLSLWRGVALVDALMFAVALAVAAIPEALGTIVTIGLAIGTQKMAKEHAIIKTLQAVESLGSVSVICSDKTGTLTQNRMTVQQYDLPGDTPQVDQEKAEEMLQKLLRCSVLCNDGAISGETIVGDPTETALLAFYRKHGGAEEELRRQYPRLQELPFDSDRKLMSTLHQVEDGYQLCTKGAPDVLLERCISMQTADGVQHLDGAHKKEIQQHIADFSAMGLRVLAFAEKPMAENRRLTLDDEQNLAFLGLVAMMDPPREETAEAVANCRRAGIRPVMITGDHKVTAAAISKQIGILQDNDRTVEGTELEQMTEAQLQQEVPHISVYARVSPAHKIRIVQAWQSNGSVVAMTGDGVNDAPALKQADIGIAMGITGTSVSKDAAAMILTDDNFATIIKAVANGRTVYRNIKHAIQFLLSGNLAGILVVVYTSLLGLPMPFTAVQLLFINLLTDSLPALAITMEPPAGNPLDEKPRHIQEPILTRDFQKNVLVQGGFIALVTGWSFCAGLAVNGEMACTMAFATLCLARLFHGFNCRSKYAVVHLPANWYSLGAFLLGTFLLLMVLLMPGLHQLFDISDAFTAHDLSVILAAAILPTLLIQLYRMMQHRPI